MKEWAGLALVIASSLAAIASAFFRAFIGATFRRPRSHSMLVRQGSDVLELPVPVGAPGGGEEATPERIHRLLDEYLDEHRGDLDEHRGDLDEHRGDEAEGRDNY